MTVQSSFNEIHAIYYMKLHELSPVRNISNISAVSPFRYTDFYQSLRHRLLYHNGNKGIILLIIQDALA